MEVDMNDPMNHPKIIELCEMFAKSLPTDMDRARYTGTVAGICKELGEFILKNHRMNELPRDIQYLLAQTWNSYATILCPDKMIEGVRYDADMDKYFNSSDIDEKFAIIVKQLYQICKDNKLL